MALTVMLGGVLLPSACNRKSDHAFVLAYTNSIQSALEPSGGTQNPLGGMPKRATFIDAFHKQDEPLLVVDAGDLLFATRTPRPDLAQQVRVKARYVARAMTTIGIDAVNVGPLDLAAGVGFLTDLQQTTGLPLISANIVANDTQTYAFPRYMVKEVDGLRVGILGVTPKHSPGATADGADLDYSVTAPVDAVREVVRTLRMDENAYLVILLSALDAASTRKLVHHAPGIAFVIETAGDTPSSGLRALGHTRFFTGTPRQQRLDTITVTLRDGSLQFMDLAARKGLESRLAVLQAQRKIFAGRIVQRPDVVERQRQLDTIEQDVQRELDLFGESGSTLMHMATPLSSSIPDDPRLAALINEYRRSLFDLPDDEPPAPVVTDPKAVAAMLKTRYVGNERCASCHLVQAEFQASTTHSQAFETLIQKGAQRDRECIGCHATGFNRKGGFASVQAGRDRHLLGVTCEACHGPGGSHAAAKTRAAMRRTISRNIPESTCVACHDGAVYAEPLNYSQSLPLVTCPAGGTPPL